MKIYTLILIGLFFIGCGSDGLTKSKAKELISQCLVQDPDMVTVPITLKEKRLNDDKKILNLYKKLEAQGLININEIATPPKDPDNHIANWVNSKKKVNIQLSGSAEEYVVERKKSGKRATFKAFHYEVDEILEIQEQPATNTALVKVQYIGAGITPFSILSLKDPEEPKIKKIKLRKTSEGWQYCD